MIYFIIFIMAASLTFMLALIFYPKRNQKIQKNLLCNVRAGEVIKFTIGTLLNVHERKVISNHPTERKLVIDNDGGFFILEYEYITNFELLNPNHVH